MKKQILHAVSSKNGITMFSNNMKDCGVETYYDENDTIRTKIQIGYDKDTLNKTAESANNVKFISIVTFMLINYLILIFFTIHRYVLAITMFYIVLNGAYSYYIILAKFMIENLFDKSLLRFHAAEHMAINAYEKYQRIPTVSEIKRASRFTKYCGSMDLFEGIFNKTLSTVFVYLLGVCIEKIIKNIIANQLPLYAGIIIIIGLILVMWLIYEVIKIVALKYELLKYLQVLVTSKPNDREIILSQKAVINYIFLEKEIENMTEIIIGWY